MNADDPNRIIALVAAVETLANAWRTMLPLGTRNLARRIPRPSGGGSGGGSWLGCQSLGRRRVGAPGARLFRP